jgi:hypothetical protein
MNIQPPAENLPSQIPTPEVAAVAPPPTPVATEAVQPQAASVYPTPSSGFGVPVTSPIMSNNSSAIASNSFDSLLPNRKNFTDKLALALGCVSVAVIPLLIFVPSLIKSMTMVTIWLVIVSALSIGGVVFGMRSFKSSDQIQPFSILGLVMSTVMLVFCLIVGSYYLKLQITINSYKNKYKSNSSLYDRSL